jgi:hypothetical protein
LREKHPYLKHTNPNFLLGIEEELEASLLVIFGNGSENLWLRSSKALRNQV